MKWNKSEEKTYWLPNHQAMFAYMASCLLLSPGAGLLGPWKDSRGFLLEPVRSQEFKDRNCSLWPSGGAQSLIWPSKSLIHEVPFVVVLPQQLVACTPSHEITSCFAEGQWENCLGSLIQSHKLSKPKKLRKKKKKKGNKSYMGRRAELIRNENAWQQPGFLLQKWVQQLLGVGQYGSAGVPLERKPNYSWRDKPAICLNIASLVHLSMC